MKVKWSWGGEPLLPPWTIARRVVAFVLFSVLRVAMAAAVLLGWGLDEALRNRSEERRVGKECA